MSSSNDAALREAVGWSLQILRRLLAIGRLDRYDAATVRSVIGALDPRLNPRLRKTRRRKVTTR
jgi:hypothetical protein